MSAELGVELTEQVKNGVGARIVVHYADRRADGYVCTCWLG